MHTSGFNYLGLCANWSLPAQLDDKISCVNKDYEGRDVTVIETQVTDAARLAHESDEEIVAGVHAELKMLMPDLPDYKSSYINRWDHFTTSRPHDTANRPSLQSPLDNLLFIGDMSFVEHPAMMMDKCNVTAKMATNLLLDKIGQKEGKIKVLSGGTPGFFADLVKKTATVFPS